jgi:hypothetical protein
MVSRPAGGGAGDREALIVRPPTNRGRRARRYETGVYADEVLQRYFPPALAVISNIAAG